MKLDNSKIIFAAGAAAGVALVGLLKTKKARTFTVNSLVAGRILKDKVFEEVANIREDADDAYEAKKSEPCCSDCEC